MTLGLDDNWAQAVAGHEDEIQQEPRLLPDEYNPGDYVLPPNGTAWITVGQFSVYLKHFPDVGLDVEVHCNRCTDPIIVDEWVLGWDACGNHYEQCSECGGDEDIESTYCGSFCQEHLRAHLEGCDICRADWESLA